jgi:hypothetical protein
MGSAASTGDDSGVFAAGSEALVADLLGRIPDLDNCGPEDALPIYAEISAGLVTALDGSEGHLGPETGTASPPTPPTGRPAGGW